MGLINKKQNQEVVDMGLTDDELQTAFHDIANKSEMSDVLKELFDKKKLYMIGDLTKDEIKLATRIYMIAKMKNIDEWLVGLNFFMKLMISKDRKSRREILDAIRGFTPRTSIIDRIKNMGRG